VKKTESKYLKTNKEYCKDYDIMKHWEGMKANRTNQNIAIRILKQFERRNQI
jgi:hypothetical protein